MQVAVRIGSGIHVFCYDNVQISTSIFVEQRGSSGPAKVTSGTFGILYKVRNGILRDMKLAPVLERFRNVKGLKFKDDRPSPLQLTSFHFQLKIVIIRVLLKYCSAFQSYDEVLELQSLPCCLMLSGYLTEQFCHDM